MTKCSCYLEKCQPTTVSQVNCHELPKNYLNYGFFWGLPNSIWSFSWWLVRWRHEIHPQLWARVIGIPTDIYTAMSLSWIVGYDYIYVYIYIYTPYVCILFFCYTIYKYIYIYYIISHIHTGSGIPSSASLHGHLSQPNNMAHDFFGPSQKSHLEQ